MNGWIKLHRKFIEWEWFDKPEMVVFFIYILSKANFEVKKWQGIEIPVGSFITSISHLSMGTFLSTRKIRTCLDRLQSTGEITIKTTNRFTILTISKYEDYQIDITENDKQTTSERQTNDKQTTTTKEIKKGKKVKKERKEFIAPSESEVIAYAVEKGYDQSLGKRVFDYYDASGWVDKNGNQVENWKLKMIGVWFKDAEKAKPQPKQSPLSFPC